MMIIPRKETGNADRVWRKAFDRKRPLLLELVAIKCNMETKGVCQNNKEGIRGKKVCLVNEVLTGITLLIFWF